jgi:hypothetical protein
MMLYTVFRSASGFIAPRETFKVCLPLPGKAVEPGKPGDYDSVTRLPGPPHVSNWPLMRFLWLVLKSAAMLFIILCCILFAARMNLLGAETGNYQYLILVLILDTAFISWAYHVIWKPIPRT